MLPAPIGATGGRSIARALGDGHRPAMIAMAALSAAAALVTALSVADNRSAVPRLAPPPRRHGRALRSRTGQ